MPRPTRAAAARATALMTTSVGESNDAELEVKLGDLASSPVSSRRLRRVSCRSGKRRFRSFSHRRADFERIAARLSAESRRPDSSRLSSAGTVLSISASDVADDFLLRPSDAKRIVNGELDESSVLAKMRLMLGKLRRIKNLAEAEADDGAEDERGADQEATTDGFQEKRELPDERDDLRGLAEVLSEDRFVSHDSNHVRLLAACALAELLRISAPDPPVSSRKLEHVCSLFIEQLSIMVSPDDDMGAYRFSLLEQLATVKTFVIFCDDNEIVCDLFACFYSISRPDQPVKVRQYMADILVSLFEETEEVGLDILDAAVAPLIRALGYSTEAEALAKLVLQRSANVLQVPLCSMLNASVRQMRQVSSMATPERVHHNRRTPVKRRRAQHNDGVAGELSAHHDHILDLMVALNKIAPDILIYVIPSLEDRVRSAEEAVRLPNVRLLARLFGSRKDMTESYPSLFAEFLSRNRDVSASIRREVCLSISHLMHMHPKHREALDKMLKDRALDRDEQVRLAAVQSIGAAAHNASEELLKVLATRLRDRKPFVRHEALKQLAAIYSESAQTSHAGVGLLSHGHNCLQQISRSSSEDLDLARLGSDPRQEIEAKSNVMSKVYGANLSWLPDTFVQAHVALTAAGDSIAAAEVERVIFGNVASKRDGMETNELHLRHFITLLSALSDRCFVHVKNMIRERYQIREVLVQIAKCRLESRHHSASAIESNLLSPTEKKTFAKRAPIDKEGSDASARRLATQELAERLSILVCKRVGNAEQSQQLCNDMASALDLRIYERILTACDSSASRKDRSTAFQDAVSRFGSKTAVGIFLRHNLFSSCLLEAFSSSQFRKACELAMKCKEAPNPVDDQVTAEEPGDGPNDFPHLLYGITRYLEIAGEHVPALLSDNVEAVCSLAAVEFSDMNFSSDLILVGAKLLSCMPKEPCAIETGELSRALRARMCATSLFDVGQSTLLAKWCARAFVWLDGSVSAANGELATIAKELAQRLDVFDGSTEGLIAPVTALSQIAKHCPQVFASVGLESFDFARVLLCGSLNKKIATRTKATDLGKSRGHRRYSMSGRFAGSSSSLDGSISLPHRFHNSQAARLAEFIHRVVKLLVYSLPHVDSGDDEVSSVTQSLVSVITPGRGDVFEMDRERSASSDDSLNITDSERVAVEFLCASSRMSAGRGILHLARHSKLFRPLPPSAFLSTLSLAQDTSHRVRLAFTRKVVDLGLKKGLPFRWTVSLALMANDSSREALGQAKAMLTSLLRHRRRVFEKARVEGNSESSKFLPEAIVSELVWVLGNRQGAESDSEAGFPRSEECIVLLLDRLLESNEYAGVLNEYIESLLISQDATEAEDEGPGPRTSRIHALARLAGAVLKRKQSGRKWNLADNRIRISLPADLFRITDRKTETSGVTPPSLLDVARKYDHDTPRLSGKKRRPRKAMTPPNAINVDKASAQTNAAAAFDSRISEAAGGRENDEQTKEKVETAPPVRRSKRNRKL